MTPKPKRKPAMSQILRTVDFVLPNPARSSTPGAGTTKLAAAEEAHAAKLAWYGQPELGLRSTDRIVPVAVDLSGGLHGSVERLLRRWAERRATLTGGDAELQSCILRGWQVRLAITLAQARVLYMEDVLEALVPGAATAADVRARASGADTLDLDDFAMARSNRARGRRASRGR